jgi:3'(2'), 5'-bisphosphate nucleotidase
MRQELNDQFVSDVIALAQRAGDAIMEVYRADELGWTLKADASPLCLADLRAHGILVAGLRELAPGISVVSEEDGESAHQRPIGGQFWLIDPLDGTKEFLSRNDEFTVNVALVEDGQPVFGLVVAPALSQAYWGAREIGAFRADAGGVCAIRVAQCPAEGPLRVVASKSHLNEETLAYIAGLGPCELVQAGSSLKICRIAEGLAHVYPRLGPTCEWDTAAAQAVLEAAGGTVLSLSGQALCYGKSDVLNPFFIASSSACYSRKEN